MDNDICKDLIQNSQTEYGGPDEDAKKKTGQIIKSMLQYDIELLEIDTSGCEDVGSMALCGCCATVIIRSVPLEGDLPFLCQ